jgi:hypothetical protein
MKSKRVNAVQINRAMEYVWQNSSPLQLRIATAKLTLLYELRGFNPQANYTDRATAKCLRS